MKEELEEGDFDTEGHYHWKKNVILFKFFLMINLKILEK